MTVTARLTRSGTGLAEDAGIEQPEYVRADQHPGRKKHDNTGQREAQGDRLGGHTDGDGQRDVVEDGIRHGADSRRSRQRSPDRLPAAFTPVVKSV